MTKKNHDLCCLKLLKNKKFLLSALIFLILSCHHQDNPKEINSTALDTFCTSHKIPYHENISSVLILSEEGCPGCNKSFSYLIQKFINNPHAFILITASGTRIDISPFQHDSIKNVYFDDRNEFSKLNLLDYSGAIFLNKKQIDTIVVIQANSIEQQLKFINDKLSH